MNKWIVLCCGISFLIIGSSNAIEPNISTPSPKEHGTLTTAAKFSEIDPDRGLGHEFRSKFDKAAFYVSQREISKADNILNEILTAFDDITSDSSKHYVIVYNAEEFDKYKSDKSSDKKVVWIDWTFKKALHLKAFLFTSAHSFDDALFFLNGEIQYAPYSAGAYIEKGYILNELRKYEEALSNYKKARDLAKKIESAKGLLPLALNGIGFTSIKLNKIGEAKAAYEESLSIKPHNNRSASSGLNHVKKIQNNKNKAKK